MDDEGLVVGQLEGTGDAGQLEAELDFVLRSIEDLDREFEAGDLAPDDYSTLKDSYSARAAEILRELEAQGERGAQGEAGGRTGEERPELADMASALSPYPSPADASGGTRSFGGRLRAHRRKLLVVGAVAAFSAAAVVFVVARLTERLPGQFATGSVSLGSSQLVDRRLAQAAVLEGEGRYLQALQVYQQVLASHPHQPVALAEAGWLEYEAGLQASDDAVEERGATLVAEAVSIDPGAYAGHLYLGTIDLDRSDFEAAVEQYRLFLAEDPPATIKKSALPFLAKAFSSAHQPLPPGA